MEFAKQSAQIALLRGSGRLIWTFRSPVDLCRILMPGILPTPHMLESLCTAQLFNPHVHDVILPAGFSNSRNSFSCAIILCMDKSRCPPWLSHLRAQAQKINQLKNILPGSLSGSPANISDETEGWRPTLAGHFESWQSWQHNDTMYVMNCNDVMYVHWCPPFSQEPYLVCEKTDGERHLLLAYQGALHFSESNVFALSVHTRPRVLDRQKVSCLELPSHTLSFLRDPLSLLNSFAPLGNKARCSFLCRTTMHGARFLLNSYPCWSCCYVILPHQIVCRAPGWHHKTLLDGELVVDSEDAEVLQAILLENASSLTGLFNWQWVVRFAQTCNPGIQSGKADMSPILGVWCDAHRQRGPFASNKLMNIYSWISSMKMALKDLTHRPLLYRLKKALFDVILPKDLKLRQPWHFQNIRVIWWNLPVDSEPAWFRGHDCLRFAEEQLLTLGRKAKDPIQLMLKDRTSNFSKRCKKLPAIPKRNFSDHTFRFKLGQDFFELWQIKDVVSIGPFLRRCPCWFLWNVFCILEF